MRNPVSCNGIHERLLDSGVPNSGDSWLRTVFGECATRKECSRKKDRRLRLSMDSVSPFCGASARQLSSAGSDLRDSFTVALPWQFDPDGRRTCSAHAEGSGPDE